MAMNVGNIGYGGVPYGGIQGASLTLRTRMDVGRIGYGNQPYGWGGYGGAVIPVSTASGDSSQLIRWRRRGRR